MKAVFLIFFLDHIIIQQSLICFFPFFPLYSLASPYYFKKKKQKKINTAQMAAAAAAALLPSLRHSHKHLPLHCTRNKNKTPFVKQTSSTGKTTTYRKSVIKCGRSIEDFIGGDLLRFDLGQWLSDVEEHKSLAIYPPHEGGYEGRYLNRLRYKGYHFLDISARGLGDPETTLTKFHPVCPAHVGKQPIARWYFPPEVDYRLSLLPPDAKGLVVWVIEAKVLSKAELQFLAILPSLRPRVRVIAECGNWRKFMWKPLKEIAGLPATAEQVSSQ